MSDPHLPQPDPAAPHRKRVVAREVTDIELANRDAATLTPDLILPATQQNAPNDPVTVIDPSTLGRRYRRQGHHRVYRWTQVTAMSAALLAAVSMICTLGEDILVARGLAYPAIALGVLAAVLSGRNTLAARWRGWAIAATVFALTALMMTWIIPALSQEEPVLPKQRQSAPQNL
jgi:hypothetical protein